MSQENVELVNTAIEVFNRREIGALADISLENLEISSALVAAKLGESTYRGKKAAWTGYFAAIDEAWDAWRIEDPVLRDAGDEGVACLCRLVGLGKHSGAPVERAIGIIFRIKDRKLWRIRSYLDPAEALEAVGLSE